MGQFEDQVLAATVGQFKPAPMILPCQQIGLGKGDMLPTVDPIPLDLICPNTALFLLHSTTSSSFCPYSGHISSSVCPCSHWHQQEGSDLPTGSVGHHKPSHNAITKCFMMLSQHAPVEYAFCRCCWKTELGYEKPI